MCKLSFTPEDFIREIFLNLFHYHQRFISFIAQLEVSSISFVHCNNINQQHIKKIKEDVSASKNVLLVVLLRLISVKYTLTIKYTEEVPQ